MSTMPEGILKPLIPEDEEPNREEEGSLLSSSSPSMDEDSFLDGVLGGEITREEIPETNFLQQQIEEAGMRQSGAQQVPAPTSRIDYLTKSPQQIQDEETLRRDIQDLNRATETRERAEIEQIFGPIDMYDREQADIGLGGRSLLSLPISSDPAEAFRQKNEIIKSFHPDGGYLEIRGEDYFYTSVSDTDEFGDINIYRVDEDEFEFMRDTLGDGTGVILEIGAQAAGLAALKNPGGGKVFSTALGSTLASGITSLLATAIVDTGTRELINSRYFADEESDGVFLEFFDSLERNKSSFVAGAVIGSVLPVVRGAKTIFNERGGKGFMEIPADSAGARALAAQERLDLKRLLSVQLVDITMLDNILSYATQFDGVVSNLAKEQFKSAASKLKVGTASERVYETFKTEVKDTLKGWSDELRKAMNHPSMTDAKAGEAIGRMVNMYSKSVSQALAVAYRSMPGLRKARFNPTLLKRTAQEIREEITETLPITIRGEKGALQRADFNQALAEAVGEQEAKRIQNVLKLADFIESIEGPISYMQLRNLRNATYSLIEDGTTGRADNAGRLFNKLSQAARQTMTEADGDDLIHYVGKDPLIASQIKTVNEIAGERLALLDDAFVKRVLGAKERVSGEDLEQIIPLFRKGGRSESASVLGKLEDNSRRILEYAQMIPRDLVSDEDLATIARVSLRMGEAQAEGDIKSVLRQAVVGDLYEKVIKYGATDEDILKKLSNNYKETLEKLEIGDDILDPIRAMAKYNARLAQSGVSEEVLKDQASIAMVDNLISLSNTNAVANRLIAEAAFENPGLKEKLHKSIMQNLWEKSNKTIKIGKENVQVIDTGVLRNEVDRLKKTELYKEVFGGEGGSLAKDLDAIIDYSVVTTNLVNQGAAIAGAQTTAGLISKLPIVGDIIEHFIHKVVAAQKVSQFLTSKPFNRFLTGTAKGIEMNDQAMIDTAFMDLVKSNAFVDIVNEASGDTYTTLEDAETSYLPPEIESLLAAGGGIPEKTPSNSLARNETLLNILRLQNPEAAEEFMQDLSKENHEFSEEEILGGDQ